MNFPQRTPRRVTQAGLVFVLALATTTLLFSRARDYGRREASLPSPSPTPASTIFNEPAPDGAARLAALRARLPNARSDQEKRELAGAFGALARSAHFHNQGAGLISHAAYDEALALYQAIGDRLGAADILLNRATTQAMLGDPRAAERDTDAALMIYKQAAAPLQQAEARYRIAEQLCRSGRYVQARSQLDRSLRIRQAAHEETGIADCLALVGQTFLEEGAYSLARASLEDAARRFQALGKAESRAAVLGQLADVSLANGDLAEAERHIAEGQAVWEKKKEPQEFWIGRFLARRARLALAQGDTVAAQQSAERSRSLLAASNSPTSVAWPLMVLGDVAAAQGDRRAARSFLDEALAQHRRAGRAYGIVQTQQALARLP